MKNSLTNRSVSVLPQGIPKHITDYPNTVIKKLEFSMELSYKYPVMMGVDEFMIVAISLSYLYHALN